MKAVVNIGFRIVRITYSVKKIVVDYSQWDKHFRNYEMLQKTQNSKIICSHDIVFRDEDEWTSVVLFDGRTIDFHYDYADRKEFDSRKEWGGYIFQGYNYVDGEEQRYDHNEVTKVVIEY